MSKKNLSSLSVFFPAYYDEHTIEPLALAIIEVSKKLTDDFEIIIVDDKSPDRVGEIADRLSREHSSVKVIHHSENMGVGQAMISGYKAASKEWVFYTDGDAQYDVSELTLLAEHTNDFDVIIGYRLKRAEGFKRVFTSKSFHFLIFILFGVYFKDIDCSFKLINRRFLRKVSFHTNSGLVDAELLIQAKRLKFPVKEVGVHHYNRKFGNSHCLRLKLVVSMLLDMVKLRLKLW